MSQYLERKINSRLSGITIEEILGGTDAAVYGGAVRDAIAGFDLHDIDIAALPQSSRKIKQKLINAGYRYMETSTNNEIIAMYASLNEKRIINMPWTFIKTINEKEISIVQVIRPRQSVINFSDFLEQVDITCCAVSYSPQVGTKEHHPDAFNHCAMKSFAVLESNQQTTDRLWGRAKKLIDRGWKDITECYKSQ